LHLLVPVFVRRLFAIAGFWGSIVGFSLRIRRDRGGRLVRFGLGVLSRNVRFSFRRYLLLSTAETI
jgi:hypothetical protein